MPDVSRRYSDRLCTTDRWSCAIPLKVVQYAARRGSSVAKFFESTNVNSFAKQNFSNDFRSTNVSSFAEQNFSNYPRNGIISRMIPFSNKFHSTMNACLVEQNIPFRKTLPLSTQRGTMEVEKRRKKWLTMVWFTHLFVTPSHRLISTDKRHQCWILIGRAGVIRHAQRTT